MARFVAVMLLLLSGYVGAGQLGQPITQRFTPLETGAQPYSFAVLAKPSGEVFVANLEGVLRYFGQRWKLIDIGGAGRSLAAGPDGEVYVGGFQSFGVLKRRPDGSYGFDRLDRLFMPDDAGAPLGEVWDTVVVDGGVYFATRTKVFYYGFDGERASIDMPGDLLSMHADADGPLVVLRDRRLLRLSGSNWSEWLKPAARVYGIVPRKDGHLLIGEDGELILARAGELEAMVSTITPELVKASAYCAAALPNGDVAIGSLDGRVFRLGADGRYSVLASSDAPVLGMALDAENGLWLATESGPMRVSLDLAWTEIDAGNGLRGPPSHAAIWNDALYVATSVGLYVSRGEAGQTAAFELLDFADTEVNYLLATQHGLLIGARTGLHVLDASGLRPLISGATVWRMFPSMRTPGRIYVMEDAGLVVLDEVGGALRESQRFLDPSYKFDELAETDGYVYVDRVLAAPMRLAVDANGRLGPPIALAPEPAENLHGTIVADDDGVYISTAGALLRIGANGLSKVERHPWIENGLAPSDELRTRRCANGDRLAMTLRKLLWRPAQSTEWRPLYPMNGRTQGINEVACGERQLFIATWSGLARFDPGQVNSMAPLAPPQIERVELVAPHGRVVHMALAEPIVVPPAHRLRLHFASPYLGGAVRYQSRLSEIERAWSDAGAQGVRDLALASGSHELQTRAIDAAGRISAVAPIRFAVARDWRALAFNTLLALVGIAVVSTLIYVWRAGALRRRNLELEAMVDERTRSLAQRTADLEIANQRLIALADMDGLTGVANRRKLEAELDRSWREAIESRAPLSLLMIDVDHFKRYNDTHGHLLGDERLQAIAERLKGWVAPGDTLARFGGEEFVLVMPGATLAIATERAQAIRRDTRAVDRLGDNSTVSIGVAERTASHAETPEQLFEFADLALYRAKNAGRDRIEVYDPS